MPEADESPESRRRERREQARRRLRRQRRLILIAVPTVLVLIGLIWFAAISGEDSEGGPSEQERRAEAARQRAREQAREDRAIDRVLGYTTFIRSGAGKKREVALTFDDGPGPSTGKVLDILRRTNTPATFFVVGSMVPGNEKTLRRIVREGHAIGNHTQNHPAMGSLDPVEQAEEITDQERAVAGARVKQRHLFRPPYRSYDPATFDLLEERGDLMVLWSVDTNDYANPSAKDIARLVLDEVKPGSIVLMHDAGGDRQETVRALPDIIRGLKKRKLKPVTIPRMVADDPPPRGENYPEGI